MTASASPSSRPPVHDVLLPGIAVQARGLAWEVVDATPAGEQIRYCLRCTQGALREREIDLLSPFEDVEAIATALDPKRAGPLPERLRRDRWIRDRLAQGGLGWRIVELRAKDLAAADDVIVRVSS